MALPRDNWDKLHRQERAYKLVLRNRPSKSFKHKTGRLSKEQADLWKRIKRSLSSEKLFYPSGLIYKWRFSLPQFCKANNLDPFTPENSVLFQTLQMNLASMLQGPETMRLLEKGDKRIAELTFDKLNERCDILVSEFE
jgi:hypothetical protein